jgi:DNA polymerase-3 subunit epsilon
MVAFLDIETTGLSAGDQILEIAIVDEDGEVLFHSLINPERPLTQRIKSITGLDDDTVLQQPRLGEVIATLKQIMEKHEPIVIYNEKYDRRYFPEDFWLNIQTHCALHAFRQVFGNGAVLASAARLAGHVWEGQAHRAIADAQACRTVWLWSINERKKMDNRFHNRSASEIAQMAFEAQQRMKSAEEDFDACKAALIQIARGAKLKIEVPQTCRVTVSEPPKITEKKTYKLNSENFEKLEKVFRQQLLDASVVEERKIPIAPRLPTIRVSPL